MQEPALVIDYDMAVGSSPAPAAAWPAHDAMETEADVATAEYEMELEDVHQTSNGHASDEVEMGEAGATPAQDVDEEIIDYTESAAPLVAASTSMLSASAPIFASTSAPISYATETTAAPLVSSVPRKSLADAPPLPDSDVADAHVEVVQASAQGGEVAAAGEAEAGLYDEPSAEVESAAAAAQAAESSSTAAELTEPAAHEAAQAAQQHSSSADAKGVTQENGNARASGGAHEDHAAAAAQDEDELANSRPPAVRVTYQGQDFVLFATAHTPSYSVAAPAAEEGEASSSKGTVEVGCPKLAAPASVFSESLDLLCEALRVGESLGDFLDDGTELVLSLPQLDLSVREDDVYAREVTLADLHRLHIGAGILGSLHLVVTEAPRFITRYNALASSVGAGDETIVEDDADNSGTSLHDSEVGYSQFEHGEADDGEEEDAAEADQTFVTVRGGSAEQEDEEQLDGPEAQQQGDESGNVGDPEEEQNQDEAEAEYERAAADEPAEAGADEAHEEEEAYDEQDEEASHEQHYEEEQVDYAEEEGAPHVEGQEPTVEEQDEQLEDYEEAEPEADPAADETATNGEAHTAEHLDEEPLIDYDEAVGDEDVPAEPNVEASADAETPGDALYEEDAAATPAHTNGKRALEDGLVDASDYTDAAMEAKRVKVV